MNTITNHQTETEFYKIFSELIAEQPSEQIYFDSDRQTFIEAINEINQTGDFDHDFIPNYIITWLERYKRNLLKNNKVA